MWAGDFLREKVALVVPFLLSSCSFVAAVFPHRHQQDTRGISPWFCAPVSEFSNSVSLWAGRRDIFFRRASYVHLDLSGGAFSRRTIENWPAAIFCTEALVWASEQLPWCDVSSCLYIFYDCMWRSLLCRPLADSGGRGNINRRNSSLNVLTRSLGLSDHLVARFFWSPG